MVDPSLAHPRKDSDDPRLENSSNETEAAKRVTPNTDKDDPNRATDLSDKEAPMFV
jgi:hypothetical protein